MLSSSFSFLILFGLPIEVILSAILLPTKSPVASAVLCTTLLPAVLAKVFPVLVAASTNFLPYLSPNFLAKDKNPYPFMYFLYSGSSECLIYKLFIPMIIVIFTLSSISNGLLS